MYSNLLWSECSKIIPEISIDHQLETDHYLRKGKHVGLSLCMDALMLSKPNIGRQLYINTIVTYIHIPLAVPLTFTTSCVMKPITDNSLGLPE